MREVQLKWNSDSIQRQLAHTEKDQIKAAYNRARYLEEFSKVDSMLSATAAERFVLCGESQGSAMLARCVQGPCAQSEGSGRKMD